MLRKSKLNQKQLPKKPAQKQQKGRLGEQLAKKLLQNKGYTFLTQNYRTTFGEIDLIFQDKDVVVFVEVKTRTTLDQGLPEEAVTPRKVQTIERVAENFLLENKLESRLARIDVVAVDWTAQDPKLTHLVNVTG